jgi:hypothetical protein
MDNVKLRDKSKIEILDPTHVNQASHTINLIEMYKNMTKKQFNKEVEELSSKERERASLYIAKAMNAFVKDDKTSIKILYFLSKFYLYFQLCIEI